MILLVVILYDMIYCFELIQAPVIQNFIKYHLLPNKHPLPKKRPPFSYFRSAWEAYKREYGIISTTLLHTLLCYGKVPM